MEEKLKMSPALAQMNGATLAYLGDAVYELLVREHLACKSGAKSSVLHKRALQFVSAKRQAEVVEVLLPLLTEEERAQYKRGRNAPVSSGKLGEPTLHARATGLEALFGYLHMTGQRERIQVLFSHIVAEEA